MDHTSILKINIWKYAVYNEKCKQKCYFMVCKELLGLTYIIIPIVSNSTIFLIDKESVLFRSAIEDKDLQKPT